MTTTASHHPPPPDTGIAVAPTYDVAAAFGVLGVSRATGYNEIAAGRLQTYTIGRRRYVSGRALLAYIAAREAESAGG